MLIEINLPQLGLRAAVKGDVGSATAPSDAR